MITAEQLDEWEELYNAMLLPHETLIDRITAIYRFDTSARTTVPGLIAEVRRLRTALQDIIKVDDDTATDIAREALRYDVSQ